MIRDSIWMYGAIPGAYHKPGYHLPGKNTMETAEACRKYGIKKALMDVCVEGPEYPFDGESEKLSELEEVVWTIIPSGGVRRNEEAYFDMEEVIRQIQKYPNVKGVFCDDFLWRRRCIFPPEKLKEMKKRIEAASPRPIDMWMVVYATDMYMEQVTQHSILEYGDPVDVISFWTWHPYHLKVLREHVEFISGKWPGKPVNVGIYLWDFSAGKPMSDELMELQLETAREMLHSGEIDGITICASCIMDIGLRTVDIFARWLEEHGEEEIITGENRRKAEAFDNERV